MRSLISKVFLLSVILPTLCVGFIAQTPFVRAYTNPGKPTGFVNDFAAMISAESQTALETKLNQFQKETSNEISVVTIATLDGDTIENYANRLFNEWGIGGKETDNGILLLIARDDREMRIEVGYGLEGAMTDLQSEAVINTILIPAFRSGDFDGGITAAADAIISATQGEFSIPIDESQEGGGGFSEILNVLGPFIFFLVLWIPSVLARSKSWWAGGIVGGIVGIIVGAVASSLIIGGIATVVLGLVGLLFDFIVSKEYSRSSHCGGNPPWWIGGGGFGGSSGSGGSSFGGFSGGSSGGGGSSGSW